MRWLGVLFLTVAVSVPAVAGADPRPLSLADALSLAEQNAVAVIQAQGQKRTAAAGVRSAYAAFLPSVSVSAGASRQIPTRANQTQVENGQVVTLAQEPWSYSTGLGASMDLFTGGGRFFDLRQAHAQATSADANLLTQRYATALSVKEQFFAVLAARESEAAASAQLDQASEQLKASILRLRQRVVTRSDSLRSEIAVHNARLAVLQARIALEYADASLTRAVGSTVPVTAAPDDSLDRPGLALDDETLRARALDGPAVRQAAAVADGSRAALRGAWTNYLPSVTASYSRGGSGTGAAFSLANDDFTYSGALRLSLSLPIFTQFQREQQVTQSQVARDNANAALRDARLAAFASLTQYLGSFHAAQERVATQTATVEAADEDLRMQKEKYDIGAATLLDVLTSQTTLDQARHDLIQARYDQRVARAQLEALVGRSL
jgi:outer membrane protein